MELRSLRENEHDQYCEMLKKSFDTWYFAHGWKKEYFQCTAEDCKVFLKIYNAISPNCNVAAFNANGDLMGCCFYHLREYHVSVGIMAVHADHFGRGVGKAILLRILDLAKEKGYPSVRLVGSAINMDSFSLYNRSGFIPRAFYHDMVVSNASLAIEGGRRCEFTVRAATLGDVEAIGKLEMDISGIRRSVDYRYSIHHLISLVVEDAAKNIVGFASSTRSRALNQFGPAFSKTEDQMKDLLCATMPYFSDEGILVLVPMDCTDLVGAMYNMGFRNAETHIFQVYGDFQSFNGVNIPSFLPETG